MPARTRLAFVACVCVILAAVPNVAAKAADVTAAQRQTIDSIIHDYLLQHPDVLIAALRAAQDKLDRDSTAKATQAVASHRQQIFDDPAQNKRAIAYLSDALRTEDKEVEAWHLLATAYGRDNQIGMAALSLAEEGLAADHKKDAVQQARRAEHLLPKNSVAHARAQEIRNEAKDLGDSN